MQEDKNYQDDVIDLIKELDTDFKESSEDEKTSVKIVQKQKTYFWVRIFLKDEMNDIEVNDEVIIKYYDEELETKFISYGKKGLETDSETDNITDLKEDNKKVLCLMVDSDLINKGEDIDFLRTLFKGSIYYEETLIN